MKIAKTSKITKRTLRGMIVTQYIEVVLLTDFYGNFFKKESGKLSRISRELAQEYFQKNFDDFWKYLENGKLHEKFPELYTKKEALEVQQCYEISPKKEIVKKRMEKVQEHYENCPLW